MFLLLLTTAFGQQVQQWPLTDRWADTPAGYFEGLHRDLLLAELGGDAALAELDYDVTGQTAHLYVPEDYEPNGEWGVFVYVYSGSVAPLREAWKDVLNEQKMIYVAPHEVGNAQDSVLRMAWALDSLASVQAEYEVDPERFVIGGFSGGGAISVMMGTAWPDVFVGTIDQCRALMWEEHPIATLPGSVFGTGEITHMDPDGIGDLANGHRFAFLSGDRDVIEAEDGTKFSNYEGILKGMGDWWDRDLRARMFDLPGLEHETVGAHAFGLALDWVLTCRDTGEFPARFDSFHMPPHTPVATPDTPPPDPCDPGKTGVSKGKTRVDEAGCGCGSSGGSAGFFSLSLLVFVTRRRQSGHTPT